jgi:type 9 secretion system plug protein
MVKIISLWLLFSVGNLIAQDFEIKSLQTYSNTGRGQYDQANFPIISNTGLDGGSITIEFDIDADFEPSLNIIFKFCDKDWQPYENIFLENPIHNTAYSLYFERLPLNIERASYHFKKSFPNQDVTFPYSGKWLYYITASNDENEIYAEGRFIVAYPTIPIKANFRKSRMENQISNKVEMGRVLNLNVDFTIPDSLYPSRVIYVEVIKNREIYDPVIIDRENYNNDRFYEWNGDREFTFIAKDIRPGKNYRRLDLNNYGKYSTPIANAQFDGVETERYSFPNKQRDNFGGMVLRDYKNDYAEYLGVKFRLRLPDYFEKDVFVVGAFSDWDLFSDYQLENENGLYTNVIELKRGIYDYQYVTAYYDGQTFSDIDWLELEGNDWTTISEYRILVYYKNSDFGEYDEIIGYAKINSGVK